MAINPLMAIHPLMAIYSLMAINPLMAIYTRMAIAKEVRLVVSRLRANQSGLMQNTDSTRHETAAISIALTYKYARTQSPNPTLELEEAKSFLAALPPEAMIGNTTLLAKIRAEFSGAVLDPLTHSIIASIDDCAKIIFATTDLESEIEQQLHIALPKLAVHLLENPALPFEEGASILTVLDHLVEATIGWSSDLGKAGEKIYEQLVEVIDQISNDAADIGKLEVELVDSLTKEQARISKLEDRLAASETGLMRTAQSKNLAASLINDCIVSKKLTSAITKFLMGPWYDSLQLIVLTEGIDSEAWFRAGKLTETIVWTYQPIVSKDEATLTSERQKLYRIAEHLPAEIRELLVSLEHSTHVAEAALESIESEQIDILSGEDLDYEDFSLIACEESAAARSKVSRLLLRKVNGMEPGQWFHYESHDVGTRIKLVLKLEDVKQLLFTNRNGMKVMQRGFDEFAYYLSSGVVRALNHEAVFSTTFKNYYDGLILEHERQSERLAQRKAEADREAEARDEAEKRAEAEATAAEHEKQEEARIRQAEEHAARLTKAAEDAARSESAAAVAEFTERVKQLAIGAWLRLPGADGQLEECKLAVRIKATSKMIFVTRSGTKIGEYTNEELSGLLVAGEAEIREEGVVVEDTLAQVVSRLRQDRTKSYDDLTRA